jgi:hypothetical protein
LSYSEQRSTTIKVEAGIRAPRAVDIKILRKHAKHVDELTHRLIAIAPKIAADAKARAKNLIP